MRIGRRSHEETDHDPSEDGVGGIDDLHDRLESALKAWQRDVDDRKKKLRGAHAHYEKTIKGREKARAEAEARRKLAGGLFGPVTLHEDEIEINHTRHPLTADVQAAVDTAGNLSRTRRFTATRFALLGPAAIFAPKAKKHDDRELFLLIEAERWNEIVKLDPDKQASARSLAQDINLAARNVEVARTAREERVAAAEAELERAIADRSEIETAERELHEVHEEGLARVQAAHDALAAHLRALPSPEGRGIKKARALAEHAASAMTQPLEIPALGARERTSSALAKADPSITGGAEPAPTDSPETAPSDADVIAQIKGLGELRDAGLITEEQFNAKRDDLLKRL